MMSFLVTRSSKAGGLQQYTASELGPQLESLGQHGFLYAVTTVKVLLAPV